MGAALPLQMSSQRFRLLTGSIVIIQLSRLVTGRGVAATYIDNMPGPNFYPNFAKNFMELKKNEYRNKNSKYRPLMLELSISDRLRIMNSFQLCSSKSLWPAAQAKGFSRTQTEESHMSPVFIWVN